MGVSVWLDAADTKGGGVEMYQKSGDRLQTKGVHASLSLPLNPEAACEVIKGRGERCPCGTQK